MLVSSFLISIALIAQNAVPSNRQAAAFMESSRLSLRGESNHKTRLRFGLWTLEIRRDPFASETACTISAPGMTFDHGALIIRLRSSANTFDAIYRIDQGPRVDSRSDQLKLARLGLAIYQEDLPNPSGGLLRIPGDEVRGAHQVRFELRRGGRVYTRSLWGLENALTSAQQNVCRT